jgi:hypothetical protein
MDALAIALVLGAALCHALWNVAAKGAGGDARFALFCSALVSLLWLPLAAWLAVDELARWGASARWCTSATS